jgi:hypothetical protein
LEQHANGSILIRCLRYESPLYSFLTSWYGRPYKPLLRDNAANDIYIPAPIRTLALLHLAPTSGGTLNGAAAPVHNLFTFRSRAEHTRLRQYHIPAWSDAGIELYGKEVAQKRYASLFAKQRRQSTPFSLIASIEYIKLLRNAADPTSTPQQPEARTNILRQGLRKERAACRSQLALDHLPRSHRPVAPPATGLGSSSFSLPTAERVLAETGCIGRVPPRNVAPVCGLHRFSRACPEPDATHLQEPA